MRLYLLPISTKRTLIYCQKAAENPGTKPSILDRATNKASETWSSWEKADKGWKKKVTGWGNVVLRRIPFEEWGLKTVPNLSSARQQQLSQGSADKKVEVHFPGQFLHEDLAPEIMQRIATGRQGLHRSKMIWSMIGAPLTLPFALVPVVPNFPGFYMLFRAYSHWKALRGSQHLQFLTTNSLLAYRPSRTLDELYAVGLMNQDRTTTRSAPKPSQDDCFRMAEKITQQSVGGAREVMVLRRWNGKLLAEDLGLPDMEVEIERAVEQVEAQIQKAEAANVERSGDQGINERAREDEKVNNR